MLINALLFLLNTLLGLLILAFLLRFYFQLTKVSFQNPAAQMVITLTNFAVKPMRRIMPSLGFIGLAKLDLSTLTLAFITQLLLTVASLWLKGFPLLLVGSQAWLTIAAIVLVSIISLSLSIFMYAILLQAILSWVSPHTPIAPILDGLTSPLLNKLRKFIPMAGNIDLTPLIAMITLQLVLISILIPLENNLLSSLYVKIPL